MIDLTYPKVLSHLDKHLVSPRSESASFLIWYFENYLRLESDDAVDSVCDQRGDKGVDGIYLNSDANVIEVYQTKLFQKKKSAVGDKLLREFKGTLSQFETLESIQNLIKSAGNAEVASLIKRLELERHIQEFDLIGYFVCNSELDKNGGNFLKTAKNINFIGKSDLESTYVSSVRSLPVKKPMSFNISGYEIAEYIVDKDHSAVIAPVMANELVRMDGIVNQNIFAYNVRGPLGRTQVNRNIAQSIHEQDKHKLFPLFHNGITIVAEKVKRSEDEVTIQNYYVVNGCQSLNALYKNDNYITDNLRILTKFIQASPNSPLAEMVTRFSNFQNGVKARDFKSNNPIQIRLQNEFISKYKGQYFFEIKRGEDSNDLEVITNEIAGQYLMAFDLKTPWATHRKYQIFEDRHSDLFGRPNVDADRIVLCHVIATRIDASKELINNKLFARYILTKYFLFYVLRLLFENDATAEKLINNPKKYVRKRADRKKLDKVIDALLGEIIIDLNSEIDQLKEDFDYRDKLRDEVWCSKLAHDIASTYKKLVDRKRLENFKQIFNSV